MSIFGDVLSVRGVVFLVFSVFAIAALGYSLGRIKIKGISLGTAGVFIIAIVFGCLFYGQLQSELGGFANDALKLVENLGLIMFVCSVGFMAGPRFFSNLRKNIKSYVLLGVIIVLLEGLVAIGCIYIGRLTGETNIAEFTAMIVGLLSGALTSTPAFSAAKDTVASQYEGIVSVGHAIAYLYGVIGIVLFVQLIPRIEKADMEKEREILRQSLAESEAESRKADNSKPGKTKKLIKTINIDKLGIMPVALATCLGILIGKIQLGSFSLTLTGGCLLVSLIFGHFGNIWKLSLRPDENLLKVMREIGLMLFLIGAGISGGEKFISAFKPIYFLYGVLMTTIPLILAYFLVKKVFKFGLLNGLGAITGGRTSTPALGTLIQVAQTEDVAVAYAATYPVALISVVLVSQAIILIFS